MNQIGIMTWEDCKTCEYKHCSKQAWYFTIAHENVFCRYHSKEAIAEVGNVDYSNVCNNCRLFSIFFNKCILEMTYEFEPVKQAIINNDVFCESFEAKQ